MPHLPYFADDGKEVPSVTTIIGRNLGWGNDGLLGFYRGSALKGQDPEEIRDKAAAIGTYIHRCIELDQENVPLDDEIRPYMSLADIDNGHKAFRLWKQWAERHDVKVIATERRLVSEKYRYGGTLDMEAVVDGRLTLLDFKSTTMIRVKHFIQLAAYEKLRLEVVDKKKIYPLILHVRWDRRPVIHEPRSLSKHWKVFQYLLKLDALRGELYE